MEIKYLKEKNLIEKEEEEKEEEIIRSIIRTEEILKQSHRNFEFAEDDLIDYYTYKIKADQSKLDYLIKLAKDKGISLDGDIRIKFNEEVG